MLPITSEKETGAALVFGSISSSKPSFTRSLTGAELIRRIIFLLWSIAPLEDIGIKHILKATLADDIDSCEVYMKGIDHSYYYEGYTTFKTEEL